MSLADRRANYPRDLREYFERLDAAQAEVLTAIDGGETFAGFARRWDVNPETVKGWVRKARAKLWELYI